MFFLQTLDDTFATTACTGPTWRSTCLSLRRNSEATAPNPDGSYSTMVTMVYVSTYIKQSICTSEDKNNSLSIPRLHFILFMIPTCISYCQKYYISHWPKTCIIIGIMFKILKNSDTTIRIKT
jgi:hypothetical protein